jgi:hypothetical protein
VATVMRTLLCHHRAKISHHLLYVEKQQSKQPLKRLKNDRTSFITWARSKKNTKTTLTKSK